MSPPLQSAISILAHVARDSTVIEPANAPQGSWVSRNRGTTICVILIGILACCCIFGCLFAKYGEIKRRKQWEEAERVDVALRTGRESEVKDGEGVGPPTTVLTGSDLSVSSED